MANWRTVAATTASALLLFLSASTAQNTPWDAPAFSVDPSEMLAGASRIPVPDGTDADVLLNESKFVFDAQGRSTATFHLIYRVSTAAGVRASSSVEEEWEPWHEERPEIRVRVITPDKVSHVLDPATVGEGPSKTQIPDVFTDGRILQAPLPAVVPGSIIEQLTVVREKAPLFERGVVRRVALQ